MYTEFTQGQIQLCYIYHHKLVKTGEDIEKEYGIPIINKRIAVTPIAILLGVSGGDPLKYAQTLEKCAQAV